MFDYMKLDNWHVIYARKNGRISLKSWKDTTERCIGVCCITYGAAAPDFGAAALKRILGDNYSANQRRYNTSILEDEGRCSPSILENFQNIGSAALGVGAPSIEIIH